jgi:hypothetical protein
MVLNDGEEDEDIWWFSWSTSGVGDDDDVMAVETSLVGRMDEEPILLLLVVDQRQFCGCDCCRRCCCRTRMAKGRETTTGDTFVRAQMLDVGFQGER